MKKMRFLAIVMATMLTFGFVSCGNDDEIPYEGIELSNGQFIEIEDFGSDATAAYKLHFKVWLSDGKIVAEGLTSKPVNTLLPETMDLATSAKVADCGKVNGLNKLDKVPAAADLADNQTAAEKHGYIIVVKGAGNVDSYENPNLHDPAQQYMRLWLEEKSGDGFKLRYEFPFTPAE
jgi:hypothetical protein